MKHSLPIYHIDRVIRETNDLFGDGAHIVYVNGQIRDDTALGKLMHDFFCTDPDEMYNTVLANRVRYFKEEGKGVNSMSSVFEEIRRESKLEGFEEGMQIGEAKGMKEGMREGMREGKVEGKQEMAREFAYSLLDTKTMSYEEIAKHVKVFSAAEIQDLDKNRLL